MPDFLVQEEDGTSLIELEEGGGFILLEEDSGVSSSVSKWKRSWRRRLELLAETGAR